LAEEFTVDKFSTLTDRYILSDWSTDLKKFQSFFQQLLFKEAAELGHDKDAVMLNRLNTYKDISTKIIRRG
jgi:hypothetical protein